MPRNRISKSSATHRRRDLADNPGLCELAMRACSNCQKAAKSDKCKLSERSDKCVECVRSNYDCDLAPFNPVKWRRLEAQRHKLQAEFEEAFARMGRIQKQIKFLETKRKEMVEAELQNIDDLEADEKVPPSPSLPNDLLVDVQSEELELPEGFADWLDFSAGTVAEASGSS